MLSQVFLNIVLDDAVEEKDGGEKVRLGMVVCLFFFKKRKEKGICGSGTDFTRSFAVTQLSCLRRWRG